MNIALDLLQYQSHLRFEKRDGKSCLFDPIRKKYIVKTPEELVRQLMILYLIESGGYNKTRIAVEKELLINQRKKRFDILIYSQDYQPHILIECKAPNIKLTDATFRQAACYNFELKADYLIITNGISTYCCEMDYEEEDYVFLERVPKVSTVIN
ncbi:MAG: type I restriction enzyme HsdR N-terminal domain-containing protein [Bacteroidota bacterium]